MSKAGESPRFLHLHSSFDAGGKEVRCVRLINAFGKDAELNIPREENCDGCRGTGFEREGTNRVLHDLSPGSGPVEAASNGASQRYGSAPVRNHPRRRSEQPPFQ